MIETIQSDLRLMADPEYKTFQSKLIPTVCPESILGVRTPQLRKYAKTMDPHIAAVFMDALPHMYYDENNLHAFLIERIADVDDCINRIELFLPYVDNWATCDGMKPKCFAKNKTVLKEKILQWIKSEHVFTVRYGILMLMTHFLDEDFSCDFLRLVADVGLQAYYVKMMIAWYFATALAKQWDHTIVYLQENRLEAWAHNKTIQKAVESYRITPEQKAYLRTLRV